MLGQGSDRSWERHPAGLLLTSCHPLPAHLQGHGAQTLAEGKPTGEM